MIFFLVCDLSLSLCCFCEAEAEVFEVGLQRERKRVSMGTEWSFCKPNEDSLEPAHMPASRAWWVSNQSSGVVHVSDIVIRAYNAD